MNKTAKMMLMTGDRKRNSDYPERRYEDSRYSGDQREGNRYAESRYMGSDPYRSGSAEGWNESRSGGDERRPFTMADAQEWVGQMENEDGTHGAHWTIDQVKQVIAQKKLDCDPIQMWAAMNMIYSDFYKVARKYGVGGNLDFYVDMAKAFLDDKDAAPNKISAYYEYVVGGKM